MGLGRCPNRVGGPWGSGTLEPLADSVYTARIKDKVLRPSWIDGGAMFTLLRDVVMAPDLSKQD